MKQNKNEIIHPIFIGDDIKQMSDLLVYLAKNKFYVSLKKSDTKSSHAYKRQYYKIIAPASQHSEVFEQGLQYCIKNNFDNIMCGYPNLDFDIVKNIKEREYGLVK